MKLTARKRRKRWPARGLRQRRPPWPETRVLLPRPGSRCAANLRTATPSRRPTDASFATTAAHAHPRPAFDVAGPATGQPIAVSHSGPASHPAVDLREDAPPPDQDNLQEPSQDDPLYSFRDCDFISSDCFFVLCRLYFIL